MGKNFTAAEKHFEKKKIKLKRELSSYKLKNVQLEEEKAYLLSVIKDNDELEQKLCEKIAILEEQVEVLKKVSTLDEKELEILLVSKQRQIDLEGLARMIANNKIGFSSFF